MLRRNQLIGGSTRWWNFCIAQMEKKKIYLFFFLFLNFSFTLSKEFPPIDWKDSKKLSWDDFKGKPDAFSDAVALTYYSISIDVKSADEKNLLIVKVKSQFDPMKSWVKKKRIKEDALEGDKVLKHEQGHFDLAEICARKFRKDLKTRVFNYDSFNEDISEIYKTFFQRLEKRQELYDHETEHSINNGKQELWNFKIEKDLIDFEDYSSEEVRVIIK